MTRWRNLGEFARLVVARFLDDDCPLRAASIAYYALLSIFPFLLAVAAILAHFLEEVRVWAVIQDVLRTYLPPRARAIVLENMEEAIRLRGPVGTASAVAFLWSAAAVVGAVRHSLNRIWNVKRGRPFWRRKVLEVVATLALGSILGSLVAISVGLSLFSELDSRAPYVEPFGGSLLMDVLRESGNILIVFAALVLIYKVLPNRRLQWGWLWPGGPCRRTRARRRATRGVLGPRPVCTLPACLWIDRRHHHLLAVDVFRRDGLAAGCRDLSVPGRFSLTAACGRRACRRASYRVHPP